jgi:hypothetical protein
MPDGSTKPVCDDCVLAAPDCEWVLAGESIEDDIQLDEF